MQARKSDKVSEVGRNSVGVLRWKGVSIYFVGMGRKRLRAG